MKKKIALLPAVALLVLTGCRSGDSVTAMTPEEGKKTADKIKTDYEEGNVELPDVKAVSADFSASATLDIGAATGTSRTSAGSPFSSIASGNVTGSASASGAFSVFATDELKAADLSLSAKADLNSKYDASAILGSETNATSFSQKLGASTDLTAEISDAVYYAYTASLSQEVTGMPASTSSSSEKIKDSDYGFSDLDQQVASFFGLETLEGLDKIPALSAEYKTRLDSYLEKYGEIASEAGEDTPFLIMVGTMKNGNYVFDAALNPAYVSKLLKDGFSSEFPDILNGEGKGSRSSYAYSLTPKDGAALSGSARLVLGTDYLPVSYSTNFSVKNFVVSAKAESESGNVSASSSFEYALNGFSGSFSVSFRYGNDAKRAFEIKEADKASYTEEEYTFESIR